MRAGEPLVLDDVGTYVQMDANFAPNVTYPWSHGIGETVAAPPDAGMELTKLAEHDGVLWEAIPGQMAEDEVGEWRLSDRPRRIATSHTPQALRREGARLPPPPCSGPSS